MKQENLKSKYNAAFNIAIKYGFCSDCRWAFESKECMSCDCYENAVSAIRQAIMKQIPKAPRVEDINNRRRYLCDRCANVLYECDDKLDLTVADEIKYCKHCGQAIDWNELERKNSHE